MDIHGQVSCVCQGTRDPLETTGPGAPNTQVLTNFPHQMWALGSFLAEFLSFDVPLGCHLQALFPRDPVQLWIMRNLYTADSSSPVPPASTRCSLWSLGRWDLVVLALWLRLGWHWGFTVLAGTPSLSKPSLLLLSY